MTSNALLYSAVIAALGLGEAHAIGFGEIALNSRLGESFSADIPLLTARGETPLANCFTLTSDEAADLPSLNKASLRLRQKAGAYQLSIRSNQAVVDPVFVLGIKAGCGLDVRRTYVLMPDPPPYQADTTSVAPSGANEATESTRPAREGETLADIAASLGGNSERQQVRNLLALRRANPDLAIDEPLSEGTEIQLPPRAKRQIARRATSSDAPHQPMLHQALANREARLAAQAKPPRPPAKTDRLIVGTAPPRDIPTATTNTPKADNLNELEERILKLETTLHTLRTEVEKLDVALMEANVAMTERNRLQLAQMEQPAVLTVAAAAPPPSATDKKMAMLFSGLTGGIVAVLLASFLQRRKERRADQEMPPLMRGYRPEIQAGPAPVPNLATALPSAPEMQVVELALGEDDTELESVEFLLASGRYLNAARTLANYIENTSPDNIRPWKMLIDLYRKCNKQAEFEEIRLKLLRKFNVHVPDWEAPISAQERLPV